MEVRQKMLHWGRLAGASLLDADGAPLTVEASVEYPAIWNHKQVDAQHIYFSRNEEARKELDGIINRQKALNSLLDDPTPQRNHLFLALSLSYSSIEIALRLHPDAWVDRENFLHKLEDHYAAEKWAALLQQLPNSLRIGMGSQTVSLAQAQQENLISATGFPSWLQTWAQSTSESGTLGPFFPSGQPPASRLFSIVAVHPKPTVLAMFQQEEVWLSWLRESLQQLLPLYHWMAWSRRNDHVSVKQTLQQEKVSQRQKGLEKKDNVRVIRGLWSGKQGVVQEIDLKGQLKVLIGKVSIKVDATEVEKV